MADLTPECRLALRSMGYRPMKEGADAPWGKPVGHMLLLLHPGTSKLLLYFKAVDGSETHVWKSHAIDLTENAQVFTAMICLVETDLLMSSGGHKGSMRSDFTFLTVEDQTAELIDAPTTP